MAAVVTFKQACPSCEAMVTIKESMIGKKVECTQCKDKFVAEKPEEKKKTAAKKDTAGASAGKAPLAGKKAPMKPEMDEDEDIEDEPVQAKSSKAKTAANGKANMESNGKSKKAEADVDADEDEDLDDAKPKKKAKKDGKSNKLVVGLALAVVGVVVLSVAAFFLLRGGGGTPKNNQTANTNGTPGNTPPADQQANAGGDPNAPPMTAETKVDSAVVELTEKEVSNLTNLLPGDTHHVFHVFFKDFLGPTSTLHDAVFRTAGVLDEAAMKRQIGFSLQSIDDLIRAENYAFPGWVYTVIHFKDSIREDDLKKALNLQAAPPVEGKTYYKTTKSNPWFDQLARFSYGIPNQLRQFGSRDFERPTFVHIHNNQTLIVGDETPVVALLQAKGQFPLRTLRPGERPALPPEAPMPPDKGGAVPGKGAGLLPAESESKRHYVSFTAAQVTEEALGAYIQETVWQGKDQSGATVTYTFLSGTTVTMTIGKTKVDGTYMVMPEAQTLTMTFPSKQATYQGKLTGNNNTLAGMAKDAKGQWKWTATKTNRTPGPQVAQETPPPGKTPPPAAAPMPPPAAKPANPAAPPMPNAPVEAVPNPNAEANPNFVLPRDEMYLTIDPKLKEILDRMESRGPENRDKILFSSVTNMDASCIPTNLPEFKDKVLRRPRQFWDVALLITETKPRIRKLGTGLAQKDAFKYQYRNEIMCANEGDAKDMQKELMGQKSYEVARFIFKLANHEIRMPSDKPKEEVKPAVDPKAPLPKPGVPPPAAGVPPMPDDKKPPPPPPEVTASQISVEQNFTSVDFAIDLVLDNPMLTQLNELASLIAGTLQVEMDAAASPSLRHALASSGKLLGEKGLTEREVPPGRYPPGAFLRIDAPRRTDREPKNRISWMAGLLPYMGYQTLFTKIKFDQSWRDPGNWMSGRALVPQFIDPSYPEYTRHIAIGDLPVDFGATHYVGIAGVGLDAASYKRDNATANKRGILGYDGSASLDEVRQGRGVSNTILMIQVPHDRITGVSPWIAGGGATLRGVPEKNSIAPFILSKDRNGKTIQHNNKLGTFALMADGSVRFIDQNIPDEVFKAMCTYASPEPEGFEAQKEENAPLVPAQGKTPATKPAPEKKPAEVKDEPKPAPAPDPKADAPKDTPPQKTSWLRLPAHAQPVAQARWLAIRRNGNSGAEAGGLM